MPLMHRQYLVRAAIQTQSPGPRRRLAYSRGFRRNQRLKVDDVEEWCFKELALQYRARHSNERFMRIDNRPFRDCVNVAGKFQLAEIRYKLIIE